jgi:hypothetical protein
MATANSSASSDYHKRYYEQHKDAILAQNRAYRQRNREKVLARKRQYYQENREVFRMKNAEYRASHGEEIRAYQRSSKRTPEQQDAKRIAGRKYYQKNRDSIKVKVATYFEAHPEKLQQRYDHIKAWEKAHPEKRRNIVKKRRAAKHGVTSTLTDAQWETIQAHYHYACVYCHKKPKRLTQDHLTPLSKDGVHTLHNVVPACHSCNSTKGNRAPLCPVQPLML